MDREIRTSFLLEYFKVPRHKGVLEDADVIMPGGSPECGGSLVVYLKGERNARVQSFCTKELSGRLKEHGITHARDLP